MLIEFLSQHNLYAASLRPRFTFTLYFLFICLISSMEPKEYVTRLKSRLQPIY